MQDLAEFYARYIACLDGREVEALGRFVHDDVTYNGEPLGLAGYKAQRQAEFRDIPDLRFDVRLVVCDGATIASRIRFDITPQGTLFGLPVGGRRVQFWEHAFYEVEDGRIARVWSVVDRAAIAAQLT